LRLNCICLLHYQHRNTTPHPAWSLSFRIVGLRRLALHGVLGNGNVRSTMICIYGYWEVDRLFSTDLLLGEMFIEDLVRKVRVGFQLVMAEEQGLNF